MTMTDAQTLASVQQLVHRLFYCLDMRDYAGLVAAFHEDGVWVRMGKRLEGRQHIMQAMNERSTTMVIHHVITNLHVESKTSHHCKAICYMTAYRHDEGKPLSGPAPVRGPLQVGVCQVEARQAGHGKWLLSYLNADSATFTATA